MSPPLMLRELTETQRLVLADLAEIYGAAPNGWLAVPRLREYVEQLAMLNVVRRMRQNPVLAKRSTTAMLIAAARSLGIPAGTPRKRRERTRSYLEAAALEAGRRPTDPQSDAPTAEVTYATTR